MQITFIIVIISATTAVELKKRKLINIHQTGFGCWDVDTAAFKISLIREKWEIIINKQV